MKVIMSGNEAIARGAADKVIPLGSVARELLHATAR